MPPFPKTRKQFGQHWLRSEAVLDAIVAAAELVDPRVAGDRVLEIGPGTGVLTARLLPLVSRLVAVEIDRDRCTQLVRQWGKTDNFLLLQGDFLSLDVDALLADFPSFAQPNKVVANIPYNITGPILEKLLGTIAHPNPHPFDSIVLLVQKEVADRLCACPGSSAFGALSVRVQYLADCQWITQVPATAFQPPPKVDSAVVRLIPRPITNPALDPIHLERLVKLGFANKRKMLRNNLSSLVERDRLLTLFDNLHINPQVRAEDLSVQQWIRLSNGLI